MATWDFPERARVLESSLVDGVRWAEVRTGAGLGGRRGLSLSGRQPWVPSVGRSRSISRGALHLASVALRRGRVLQDPR